MEAAGGQGRWTALAVNNLGQIRQFAGQDIPLYGDYGLNLYNTKDFIWAKEQGLFGAVQCHEAFDNGFGRGMTPEESAGFGGPTEALPERFGLDGETVLGGRIPLMISAHCPIGDAMGCKGSVKDETGKLVGACDSGRYELKDRKGRCYPILTEKMDCRTMIFSQDFETDGRWEAKDWKAQGYNVRLYGMDATVF